MTVGNSYRFEVPLDTDSVTVRVRAFAPDGPGGRITHTNWSQPALRTFDRQITIPTPAPITGFTDTDNSIREGVSGLFALLGLEGEEVDSAIPIMPIIICLLLAGGIFGAVVLLGGGGPDGYNGWGGGRGDGVGGVGARCFSGCRSGSPTGR